MLFTLNGCSIQYRWGRRTARASEKDKVKTAGVPKRACAQRRASPLTGGLRDIDKLKRVFTYLLLVCRAATSAGGRTKKIPEWRAAARRARRPCRGKRNCREQQRILARFNYCIAASNWVLMFVCESFLCPPPAGRDQEDGAADTSSRKKSAGRPARERTRGAVCQLRACQNCVSRGLRACAFRFMWPLTQLFTARWKKLFNRAVTRKKISAKRISRPNLSALRSGDVPAAAL